MPDASGNSAGYVGRNTKLYWSTDAGATWTEVKETKSIEPAEPSVDKAELTHLTSPNRRREFRQTYTDDGSVAVVCNALNVNLDAAGAATQEALYAASGSHDADSRFKIEVIDDSAVVHRTLEGQGDVEGAKFGPFSGGDPVDFTFSILRGPDWTLS